MKRFLTVCAMLAALSASAAFSSAKWLAERGDDSDVLRLRKAYAACLRRLESPAENVAIPLEHYADGMVKSRLTAARAQVFADSSYVWAEKISVEQFEPNGKLHARLDAENCVVDRATKTGWVEGTAKMVYGDSSVKGRGIYFSLEREFIKIFAQSEIRTQHGGLNLRSLVK